MSCTVTKNYVTKQTVIEKMSDYMEQNTRLLETQPSNKYSVNACQRPSTDAGPGDTAGKKTQRSLFS